MRNVDFWLDRGLIIVFYFGVLGFAGLVLRLLWLFVMGY